MDWLSPAAAAERLRISERQVRRLAEAGLLDAQRVGGRWLVSADAVRNRRHAERGVGRPLSPAMAWLVLHSLSRGRGAEAGVPALVIEDRRLRHRLRSLVVHAPPVERWEHWLRARGRAVRVWVHPGVLDQFAADLRLHVGGARVAAQAGLGVGAGAAEVFYIDEAHLAGVLDEHQVQIADDGPVLLRVVPSDVAQSALGEPGAPVVSAAALADLLGSRDARERHAAGQALAGAQRRAASELGSPSVA